MAHPVSSIPVVLFPLKLETRFVMNELWIRVFPDLAFLQGHDPILTKEEREDARLFKQQASKEEQKVNFENLVNKHGLYRTAWLVHIREAELIQQEQNAASNNKNKLDEFPSFHFKWLPDRLVYYLYKENDLKPSYKKEGSVIKEDGLAVLVDNDQWIQDFDAAIKKWDGY